jgi:hypothetical protein
VMPSPVAGPFRAQWIIEPDAAVMRSEKPADGTPRARRVGRRRSRLQRRIEYWGDWLRRWRAVISVAAISVLAGTFVYLRRVDWQPPWQLPESSNFIKWFGGGSRGEEAPDAIPSKPRGF